MDEGIPTRWGGGRQPEREPVIFSTVNFSRLHVTFGIYLGPPTRSTSSRPITGEPTRLLALLLLPQEWGDDHEAEAVMHLRTPILSAAIAMGLGGITTVHQVALSSVHLEREVWVAGCPRVRFLSCGSFSLLP